MIVVLPLIDFAITSFAPIVISQTAYSNTYYCGESNGVPITFVMGRVPLPMIRWVSVDLPTPPAQRCQTVSRNFQLAHERDRLGYITTGVMNKQLVVCTTSHEGGKCEYLLFTLKPGSDPKYILRKLLDRRGLVAGNPLDQTGSKPIYLDVKDYLNRLNQQINSSK
jgi:hypothetical protein